MARRARAVAALVGLRHKRLSAARLLQLHRADALLHLLPNARVQSLWLRLRPVAQRLHIAREQLVAGSLRQRVGARVWRGAAQRRWPDMSAHHTCAPARPSSVCTYTHAHALCCNHSRPRHSHHRAAHLQVCQVVGGAAKGRHQGSQELPERGQVGSTVRRLVSQLQDLRERVGGGGWGVRRGGQRACTRTEQAGMAHGPPACHALGRDTCPTKKTNKLTVCSCTGLYDAKWSSLGGGTAAVSRTYRPLAQPPPLATSSTPTSAPVSSRARSSAASSSLPARRCALSSTSQHGPRRATTPAARGQHRGVYVGGPSLYAETPQLCAPDAATLEPSPRPRVDGTCPGRRPLALRCRHACRRARTRKLQAEVGQTVARDAALVRLVAPPLAALELRQQRGQQRARPRGFVAIEVGMAQAQRGQQAPAPGGRGMAVGGRVGGWVGQCLAPLQPAPPQPSCSCLMTAVLPVAGGPCTRQAVPGIPGRPSSAPSRSMAASRPGNWRLRASRCSRSVGRAAIAGGRQTRLSHLEHSPSARPAVLSTVADVQCGTWLVLSLFAGRVNRATRRFSICTRGPQAGAQSQHEAPGGAARLLHACYRCAFVIDPCRGRERGARDERAERCRRLCPVVAPARLCPHRAPLF